jgi:6-pyruvoyltetrahydropterin/6-carboxytetrahydropterin synthase
MVVDFSEVKRRVKKVLDHQDLNEVLPFNPTAENIARWIADRIPFCYRVSVQESEGNKAIYEK